MPNQNKDYCFPTIQAAANMDISGPVLMINNTLTSPLSFVPVTATGGMMIYRTSSNVDYSVWRNYPACSTIGPIHNTSGLSIPDVVQASWMVVAVFACAWGIKQLRRSL
jgi:hypothetical protein